tara:strand:- start:296 stop:625 length:330 start_codon:yes stop_codon:yes gene_type:complete
MDDLRTKTDRKRLQAYAEALVIVGEHPEVMDDLLALVRQWGTLARQEKDTGALYWYEEWRRLLSRRDLPAMRAFMTPRTPYERGMLIASPLVFARARRPGRRSGQVMRA